MDSKNRWFSFRWIVVVCLLFVGIGGITGCQCGPAPDMEPGQENTTSTEATQDGGADKTPLACSHLCDCKQGEACEQGKCAIAPGAIPVYCCGQPGCVPGAKCVDRSNKEGVCPTQVQCISSGDCGQPSCKDAGNDCEELIPDCINGQCSRVPKPAKNATCDSKLGICVSRSPACVQHCECSQGQFCDSGQCKVGPSPVYCCSKAGCPAGANCYEKDGSVGSCQGNNKCVKPEDCGISRCSQQGDQCTALVPVCRADGACESKSSTSTGRCGADGRCIAEQSCVTHCDCEQAVTCVQGKCVPLSSRRTLCCDKAGCSPGEACYKKDGTPDVCGGQKICSSDSECGTPKCSNTSTSSCRSDVPYCDTRTGACAVRTQTVPMALCDPTGTKCVPIPPPGCKVDCDCDQGFSCVGGQCTVIPGGRAFCCDKPGCVAGQTCTHQDGRAGTCPTQSQCSQDADCGKLSCRNSGNDCVVSTPFCDKQQCTSLSKTTTNAICDTATATCKPRPQGCNNHCDCQQGYFCYQNACQRGSYALYCCENPGCPQTAYCVTRAGQTEFCPVPCTSLCDCPTGQDCVGGKCAQSSNPAYCCDNPQQCPSGSVCKDKTGKSGTCPTQPRPCKSVCDCVQGESCTNGSCQPSPATPTYCCDNTGCPAGKGCVSKANLSGICPKSCKAHCDCDQGEACVNGLCQTGPLIGKTYCCNKTGCPIGEYCYEPDGQFNQCPQTNCKSPCDCSQGEDCRSGVCIPTQPPVYCCSKAGCTSGSACKDATNQWGKCPTQSACKTPCDCPQGEDCFNGQCVGIFPAVYCCSNVGCPVGQACIDNANQNGFCPGAKCKTACDCPIQGQSCVRGSCAYLIGSARIYCCDKPYCPAGNSCEDTQGNLKTCSQASCKTPCDCNQGEDCRNSQCVLVSPPVYCCSKLGCPQQQYPCVRTDGTPSVCGRP